MTKDKLTFQLRTIIHRKEYSFGPGIAKIMELVRETGSLSKAYSVMGLSSSKGWRILKRAEEDLGFPLLVSTVGGSGGGNTKITPEGEIFLEKYYQFIEEINKEAETIFSKYFNEYDF